MEPKKAACPRCGKSFDASPNRDPVKFALVDGEKTWRALVMVGTKEAMNNIELCRPCVQEIVSKG